MGVSGNSMVLLYIPCLGDDARLIVDDLSKVHLGRFPSLGKLFLKSLGALLANFRLLGGYRGL